MFQGFKNKWNNKKNTENEEIKEETEYQLLQYIASNEPEFIELIEAMVEKENITTNLETSSLVLVKEDDSILEYRSDITEEMVKGSKKAYQERKKFYDELNLEYKEKVIEKYDKTVLDAFKKEIEEKAKPSDFPTWLKKVTIFIICDDISARHFIRENIDQIKGIYDYIEDTYPEK